MKTYFRIRMQALKWWAYILDENTNEMVDHHIGPFTTFNEANEAGQATGLIDIDRTELPRGSQLS